MQPMVALFPGHCLNFKYLTAVEKNHPDFCISQLWRKIFLRNVVLKRGQRPGKKYWVIIINSEVVSIHPCTNYIVIRLQLHLLPHLNLLITSGKIPENVNIAGDSFVLPLQGQMVLTWNFPGTSLLPVISKVVERHIHTWYMTMFLPNICCPTTNLASRSAIPPLCHSIDQWDAFLGEKAMHACSLTSIRHLIALLTKPF